MLLRNLKQNEIINLKYVKQSQRISIRLNSNNTWSGPHKEHLWQVQMF